MFTLSSGNYRKRSAHVHCIIVFAVVIGRAQIGCRENVVLETLGGGKTAVRATKLLCQGTALLLA